MSINNMLPYNNKQSFISNKKKEERKKKEELNSIKETNLRQLNNYLYFTFNFDFCIYEICLSKFILFLYVNKQHMIYIKLKKILRT